MLPVWNATRTSWSPGKKARKKHNASSTPPSLIMQIKFNAASGNETDSVNSYSFTDNGSVGSASGLISNCRTFNGTSQFFDTVTSAAVAKLDTYPATWTGWVKTSTVDGDNSQRGIFTNYAAGSLRGGLLALYQGTLRFWFFTNGTTNNCIYDGAFGGVNSGNIADGNWHHWAVTLGSGGAAMYIDGNSTPVSTRSWTGSAQAASGTSQIFIGAYHIWRFAGSLDVIKVFSSELNTTQIAADYNSGAGVEY